MVMWPVQQSLRAIPRPPLWIGAARVLSARWWGRSFLFLYPLLPWIGVMLLGFGAAVLFERAAGGAKRALLLLGPRASRRRSWCCASSTCTASQPLAGAGARRGAPCIDFLNTTKYPPSLLFLLMTLGPAAIFCAYAERCAACSRTRS